MLAVVRSIHAVVAGYAAMAVIVVALSVLLKKFASGWMGDEGDPNPTYIVTNLSYSFAAAILGG